MTLHKNNNKKKIKILSIYLAGKSADMPAHGNESEGSILLAQSNAFLANWFVPSSRLSLKKHKLTHILENTDIPKLHPGCFIPYDAQRNRTLTMFDNI